MEFPIESWEKLSPLKPKLKSQVETFSHCYREQDWFVMSDSLSGTNLSCPAAVFEFIKLLDGQTSIGEAYEQSCRGLSSSSAPRTAPDQIDILKVIATLHRNDMLEGGLPVNANELYERYETTMRRQRLQRWSRPLSVRFSLWNPDAWLTRHLTKVRWIFTPAALGIFTLIMLIGGFSTAQQWPQLSEHFSSRFLDPQNLLLIWLIYPLIKFVHELGHAFTAKVWGGHVHDLGVLFLVFVPVPYVDASSSYRFNSKFQRMAVAAAGIVVELILAATAILLWQVLDAGFVKDIAFNIAVVAGMSTLFVNGNPLLRFDGYYVLTEAIEIPNLSSRATQYLGYLSLRTLLGRIDQVSPVRAAGEARWLFCYGVAAGLYRWFISFSIALFVASAYFALGVTLAIWFALQQIVWPVIKSLTALFKAMHQHQRARALLVRGSTVLTALLLVFLIPWHSSTITEGIMAPPEKAAIRAASQGFLRGISQVDGAIVQTGQLVFEMENLELVANLEVLEARRLELDARKSEASISNTFDSQIIQQEINALNDSLRDIERKVAALKLKSPLAGTLALTNRSDMLGRFYRKGDVLGFVVDSSQAMVQTVVPESRLSRFQGHIESVEVTLVGQSDKIFNARLVRQTPQASHKLPSAQLGSAQGGQVRVDARDETGLTSLDPVYHFELALEHYDEPYLAAKVFIKFRHAGESLGEMLYYDVRNLFLHRFLI